MSLSLPPDKLADIQQLALSLWQGQYVTVCRVMSFWVRPIFVPMATLNCSACVVSFGVTCYMSTILPTIYFLVFIFPFPHYINLNSYLICNRAQFLCNFLFLVWLLLLKNTHSFRPFILRDLVYLYQLVDPGQVLCAGLILPCRSFRLAMMLHRMAFCLSGEVVALHLDNSMAKAYLCNQGGIVSPFLSRLACQILNLTDKYDITLILANIPTHLNVEANYLSWDQMLLEWHLLPRVAQAAFHLWAFQRWNCWHLLVPLNASIIIHWNLHYLWGPWG